MHKSTGLILLAAAVLIAGYLFFSNRSDGLQPVPGGKIAGSAMPPGLKPGGMKVVERKVVELNSATLQELETLPGITPDFARKIVAARPYQSMADLSRTGIPRNILDEISPPAVIRLVQQTPR